MKQHGENQMAREGSEGRSLQIQRYPPFRGKTSKHSAKTLAVLAAAGSGVHTTPSTAASAAPANSEAMQKLIEAAKVEKTLEVTIALDDRAWNSWKR